jgi:hypothetical protein
MHHDVPVFIPIKCLMNMMVRNAYRSRPEITKKPRAAKRKTEIVSRHVSEIALCNDALRAARCITPRTAR